MSLISNYPKVLNCLSKSESKDPRLSKDLKKLDSSSTSINANGFINSSIFSVGTKPNLLLLLINFLRSLDKRGSLDALLDNQYKTLG